MRNLVGSFERLLQKAVVVLGERLNGKLWILNCVRLVWTILRLVFLIEALHSAAPLHVGRVFINMRKLHLLEHLILLPARKLGILPDFV